MEQYFIAQIGINTQAAVDGGIFFEVKNSFRPFILTVDSGADSRYTIPTFGGGYNYSVNTSDGQIFNGVMGNQLILFPLADTLYDIEIRGLFPRIYVNNNAERLKPKDVKQWGDVVWKSFDKAFYRATNLTATAIDTPNVTLVTDGTSGFRELPLFSPSNFNSNFSELLNGYAMFFNSPSFNPPNFAPTLDKITDGTSMFYLATNFAQEIYAPNSVHLLNDTSMFTSTKIAKITMNNTALTTSNYNAFQCPLLTDLILIDRKVDLRISYSPLLLGAKIDALANSVADLTGFPTRYITMTLAQRASCNQALWTNKNWTIIAN